MRHSYTYGALFSKQLVRYPYFRNLFAVRSHKLIVYFHKSHHSRMSRFFSVAVQEV